MSYFDHLSTSTWTFITVNVDTYRLLTYPPSPCPRSYWATHDCSVKLDYYGLVWFCLLSLYFFQYFGWKTPHIILKWLYYTLFYFFTHRLWFPLPLLEPTKWSIWKHKHRTTLQVRLLKLLWHQTSGATLNKYLHWN